MDSSRPNVLVIHGHDIGRYLGCYGVDIETPNVDTLAADGALFERHFATAPQCSPSRGSLMTGRAPHVNGLMGLAHGDWELHDDERILPQYLSDAGYETHLFGLQHITQNTDRLEYDRVHSEGNLYPGVSPAVHQANRARNVASVVSSFLDASEYEEPFFASIGFFECHRAEEDDGRFGFDAEYYEADDPDDVRPLPYLPDRRGLRHDLGEMHGMMYAFDAGVGAILDALAENGLEDDTLVLVTTEHGIAFPRAKGTCYDAGIEAALVMRYPGVIDADERYDELVSNVDVLPTVLDLADVEIPDRVDGRSVAGLISDRGDTPTESEGTSADPGDAYTERDRIFAEMTWHDMYNPVRAIRTDRYKYIRSFWHLPTVYLPADVFASESGREVRETDGVPLRRYEELYDLRDAPQEDDNVVYEPRYQDVRQELSRELYEWMDDTDDPLLEGPVLPGDYDEIQSWPHESS
ncbi:Arylsulfatase A [Natronorubrum sediminis]|uniref:Arylsulfatase A n=1 Tax=Natronorubrum sediminis TaxID=640943 RepID=A0A1H6FXD4_9EURY|nr:sulfatase [Natronorubrum sediminis]SEH15446.1 Arylsulfatase A [Natronorubrum sediminis]